MKKKVLKKKSLPNIIGKRVLICLVLALAFVNFTFAQEDMTDRLVNPSFDDGTGGWTFDGISAYKISTGEKAGGLIPGGQNHLQLWTGSGGIKGKVYQEISGLPNGKYSLSAAFSSSFAGTTYLYANDEKTEVISGDNKYYEVVGVVFNGSIEVGIEVATTGSPTIDFDDFTLSFLGSADIGVLVSQSEKLVLGHDSLSVLGFTAAASELTVVIDKYADYDENTSEGEIGAAIEDVANYNQIISDILSDCTNLAASVTKSEQLLADCEVGIYVVGNPVKENLSVAIEAAKGTMQSASMTELLETVDKSAEAIGEVYSSTIKIISISYPLLTAKTLADKIGGLENTDEYLKVIAGLNAVELSFDDVVLDVQALNLVCKNAMTDDFLNTASDENPINLTSFIVNPNIYQSGSRMENPTGWICERNGADNANVTNGEYGDAEFNCYSWTGNADKQIGKSHYWQQIGGNGEGVVNLPDGLYVVKAATYVSGNNGGNILLYASSDSINFSKTDTNTDKTAYDNAKSELGTTTELTNVEVRGGILYLGIKGRYLDEDGVISGTGNWWNADNFRLYYVSRSAVSAYQERLQIRIDKGLALHNTLVECGIDDSEYLGYALGEDSLLVTSESIEEIEIAIEEMDELIGMAEVIIENYKELSTLVTAGENLYAQLESGVVVAQPAAMNAFVAALEAAEEVYADLSWDNMHDNTTKVAAELKETSNAFKVSVAICYPLAKAKLLAERIGGMSDNPAYLNVVADLKNDNLEQMDADLDVMELNAACVAAMTPEVLATASLENPFEMTSFIINPNIFQNSVNEEGNPTNGKVNGWIYQGVWGQGGNDGQVMTASKEGDTWLHCYSWSGHANNNVGLGNNYYQVVGANGEGTIALPNGTYRISAATYAGVSPGNLDLYAVTRDSYMDGEEVAYKDSVYYANKFNGDKDSWDLAQSTVGTTTDVSAIHVKNGTLCIGARGTAVIGGNGRSWSADNFRLYFLSADEIPDNVDETLVDGNAQPEFVDVYDLTGRLIRSQVKATNAVEGLKKGFYIVGGKKMIVK